MYFVVHVPLLTLAGFLYLDIYCCRSFSSIILFLAGLVLFTILLIIDLDLLTAFDNILQMVPTIQDAPTQANNVQPSQDNAEDQYRLASWPAQELLDSTKTTQDVLKVWKEFPHPPELMKLPHYVPSELREIVRLSLVVEQDPQPTKQTPTIIETASGDSMLMSGGLSRPQTSSSRASSRERSTSGSSPRTSIESSTRTSKGSHNHSIAKGLEPALKMGPLGWIGSAPEKEKPLKSSLLSIARKTKRPKDAAPKLATPKAETNLMKFLKEQKQPGYVNDR